MYWDAIPSWWQLLLDFSPGHQNYWTDFHDKAEDKQQNTIVCKDRRFCFMLAVLCTSTQGFPAQHKLPEIQLTSEGLSLFRMWLASSNQKKKEWQFYADNLQLCMAEFCNKGTGKKALIGSSEKKSKDMIPLLGLWEPKCQVWSKNSGTSVHNAGIPTLST